MRWTRASIFQAGWYHFGVKVDDGVRVYVDNQLFIDEWHESAPAMYGIDLNMGAGEHTVRVEYFDAGGNAQVMFVADPVTAVP